MCQTLYLNLRETINKAQTLLSQNFEFSVGESQVNVQPLYLKYYDLVRFTETQRMGNCPNVGTLRESFLGAEEGL